MNGAAKTAGLVLGCAALGAGLALLYAPQSGSDTRRQIRHYAKRAQWQANRFGRNFRDSMDKAIERGKSFVAA